jgi:hypothetical protein
MTTTFNSLGALASFMGAGAIGIYREQLGTVLEEIAVGVKHEVERRAGTYQQAIGPFPATAPLSPVTLEIKKREGWGRGGPDTPLYATGEFENTVQTSVDKGTLTAVIGTDLDYMVDNELGDNKRPPRPIFGPAALAELPKHEKQIAERLALGLTGVAISTVVA